MRRPVLALVLVLMLLGAVNAGATDIAGKWGIGAALFNTGFETSLIRGHSNRTAWVFDVSLNGGSVDRTDKQSTSPDDVKINGNDWGISVGPSLRRFFRPESEFSPYGDLFVAGNYQRQHGESTIGSSTSTSTNTLSGVETGLRFGLEYFTRWHFSIAADTDILSLRWDRFSQKQEQQLPAVQASATENRYAASFALAPRLLVRAYF